MFHFRGKSQERSAWWLAGKPQFDPSNRRERVGDNLKVMQNSSTVSPININLIILCGRREGRSATYLKSPQRL